MKIGFDTFGCDHGRSGLGAYLYSFVQHLPSESENSEFCLFGSEIDRYTYIGESKNINYKSINMPDSLNAERFWHYFKANKYFSKNDYDAIVFPAAARFLPKKFDLPGIAIINDVVSSVMAKDDFWTRKVLKKSLSNVDCIIASSKYIKKDLEKYGITNKRIEVVYNGIDHGLFYCTDDFDHNAEFVNINPFAIKRPYIIYASRMQKAEKKHLELIKAFELFKEKTKSPHRLVIAGSEGPYSNHIHKAAYTSKFASDIFITGYFPHENFPKLYANAEACIFPSVSEGVGLPVLEAMATGLPVACSNEGALKEISGSNAILFDSNNIEEMAAAIERILTDEELRLKLKKDGIEWTKRFTWDKTVANTLSIIEDVVKNRNN